MERECKRWREMERWREGEMKRGKEGERERERGREMERERWRERERLSYVYIEKAKIRENEHEMKKCKALRRFVPIEIKVLT